MPRLGSRLDERGVAVRIDSYSVTTIMPGTGSSITSFRGALATLFVTTTLYLAVNLSIGYLLSVLIRSQLSASQIAMVLTLLPAVLLSGYVFPIDQMPPFIQDVTYLVYSRYYVTIIKAIFLKGSGFFELLTPVLFLIVYALAVVVLAARAFRKRLA